jgi:2-polyprenyl-6-methoxyphenol hydroxylase-like FAD-dependent oxidoreductase
MKPSTVVPLRVGVVGAGIAGLTLAGGLRRRGHDVTVFEKAPRLMAVGAGISVAKNAVRALDELGLIEDVLGDAVHHEIDVTAVLLRPDGSSAVRVPPRRMGVVPMTRAVLHAALAGPAGEVRLGVAASVDAAGAPVITADGERHEFDVVVAADGVRSPSRATLGLDPGLRYAGWTTWRGVTTEPFDLRGRMSETWGGGAMVGLVPMVDGRTYWFAAQHAPPNVTVEDARADVLGRFGTWHAPIRQVVEATDPRGVIRTDAYDLAHRLPTYVRGRVVLVGDAAHAMTPNLGQGANQAIVDVAALAKVLDRASGTGVDAALRAYDARRRRPSQRVAANSRRLGQVALAEGIAGKVRESTLGALAAITGGVRR